MTSTEPYQRRKSDRGLPDGPSPRTTDVGQRSTPATFSGDATIPVQGRIRTDNLADPPRPTGTRHPATIDQLRDRQRDAAQTRTPMETAVRPETAVQERARQRRERQERLKAEIAEMERQLQESRLPKAEPRKRPVEGTRPAMTSARPTAIASASITVPASARVSPESNRADTNAPPVEAVVTSGRDDRPERTGDRQRSTRDGKATERLRLQQEQREQREKQYELEDLERKRRIEERKAKRAQELKDESEAQARRAAEDRERRATSARLASDYETERRQLIAEAGTVIGRLRTTDWAKDADPLKAHVFALALRLVKAKMEPLITSILAAVQKHKTVGEQTPADLDIYVVELGAGNDAASGVATPTFMNFPINIAPLEPFEQGMRRNAAEGTLTEAGMRHLRAEIQSTAEVLAPTVIHEFTHMAMYKMYRNKSNPWLSMKKTRKLGALEEGTSPTAAISARLAEARTFVNVDLRDSDLTKEKEEFKAFADRAPLEVRVICQRLSAYSSGTQSSELPSHLMEVVYLKGEKYVRDNLPLCHRVLVRVSEQVAPHLGAGLDKDWFAAHSLPTPKKD